MYEFINILKDNKFEKSVDPEMDKELSKMLSTADFEKKLSIPIKENSFFVEFNGYHKVEELDSFLAEKFLFFKKRAAERELYKEKIIVDDLVREINKVRRELEDLQIHDPKKIYKNFSELKERKIFYTDQLLRFLRNIKSESIALNGIKAGQKTFFTQKQTVVLFSTMHRMGYIGKEMPKTELAKILKELTGFSSDQIRHDLSNIEKESKSLDAHYFAESDYTIVIRELKKILNEISKEKKQKFSL